MKATMGKQGECKPLGNKTFLHMLRAGHSPIDEYRIWFDITAPERVHTHVVRHEEIGKFVATSRPDISYGKALEEGHRMFSLQIPAKRLIEIMRIRLCGKAWPDTRVLFNKMKQAVIENDPIFAHVLHPTCCWYGFCPEYSDNTSGCSFYSVNGGRKLLLEGIA